MLLLLIGRGEAAHVGNGSVGQSKAK